MTPAVRRLARERGVDVSTIVGTGIGGRITRSDIEMRTAGAPRTGSRHRPAPPRRRTPPAAPSGPRLQRIRSPPRSDGDSLKRLTPHAQGHRRAHDRFLEVPTAYITVEVDMTPVVKARAAANAAYKAREGISLSYVAYMTKACVEALRSTTTSTPTGPRKGTGAARTSTSASRWRSPDGLLVPVIRNADISACMASTWPSTTSPAGAQQEDHARRAQGRHLHRRQHRLDRSVLTLPIINVPEVAIITMEKIVKRPVVLEDQGDAIAVRSMMNMCIAIDHRATDGAQAGEFLPDVRHGSSRSTPTRPSGRDDGQGTPHLRAAAAAAATGTAPSSQPMTIAMGGSVDASAVHRAGPPAPPRMDPGQAAQRRQLQRAQGLVRGQTLNTVCEEAAVPTSASAGSSAPPRS